MGVLFWILGIIAWGLLVFPVIKKGKLEKELCRKLCKGGCWAGIFATVCFVIDIKNRSDAMWNGDVSEQLLVAILSITLIPLGIYMVVFAITHFFKR